MRRTYSLLSLLLASACTPDGVLKAGATQNEGAPTSP